MTADKVWLVTGAGRGMGVDIAKAALEAGYKVVATESFPSERTLSEKTFPPRATRRWRCTSPKSTGRMQS